MKKRDYKIYNFILALFPILDIYSSPINGLSIGQVILLLISCMFLIKLLINGSFKIDKKVLIFAVYLLGISVFSMFSSFSDFNKSLYTLISQIMYIILLIIGLNIFNLNYFSKYYIRISLLVSFLAFIQFIFFSFFDKKVIFILPFLKLENGVTREYLTIWFSRITGCFTEPAHLVQYLSIACILILIKPQKKQSDVLNLFFFTILCIFTQSGNGLITLAIIYTVFVIIYFKITLSVEGVIKIIFFLLIAFCLCLVLYMLNDNFRALLSRFDEITGNSSVSISGYVRVLRGYELYGKFDIIRKIFGIGVGNIGPYCQFYNIQGSVYVSPNNGLYEYLNAIQFYLTGLGVVGLVLYLRMLIRLKNINELYLYSTSLIIGYSFIAAIFASPIWLILVIIVIDSKKIKNKEYCYVYF